MDNKRFIAFVFQLILGTVSFYFSLGTLIPIADWVISLDWPDWFSMPTYLLLTFGWIAFWIIINIFVGINITKYFGELTE
jgi:hypothetical protein